MFGLSFGEVILLVLLTLVVVGPRELPSMMRSLGRTLSRMRRMTTQLREQSGIDEILRAEGIDRELQELRKLAQGRLLDVNLDDVLEENVPPPPRWREYPPGGVDVFGALPEEAHPYFPTPEIVAATPAALPAPEVVAATSAALPAPEVVAATVVALPATAIVAATVVALPAPEAVVAPPDEAVATHESPLPSEAATHDEPVAGDVAPGAGAAAAPEITSSAEAPSTSDDALPMAVAPDEASAPAPLDEFAPPSALVPPAPDTFAPVEVPAPDALSAFAPEGSETRDAEASESPSPTAAPGAESAPDVTMFGGAPDPALLKLPKGAGSASRTLPGLGISAKSFGIAIASTPEPDAAGRVTRGSTRPAPADATPAADEPAGPASEEGRRG